MAEDTRPSLSKTLDQRYATQHEGGAFDVKQTLGQPGTSPAAGSTIPIPGGSTLAQQFLTPKDFLVKEMQGVTQMKDAIEANTTSSPRSKQLSRYLRGFDNRKYRP